MNPSVDKTYILNKFIPNSVNRADRVMSNAGSKGINVSRVSILLGQKTCALGLSAETPGSFCSRNSVKKALNPTLSMPKISIPE
jgi:tagatose 6-phosphate kinase